MHFTELFFPIDEAVNVMKALNEYWADNAGYKHTGAFNWEFYLGKRSTGWLSAAN